MSKYILTNKAIKDLSDIWNYTVDNWSEKQADKYYKMLLVNCQFLAEKPDIGKNYDIIFKQLLGHRVGRHIIFYRIGKYNHISIIRILHEQMDIKRRIKE